MINYNELKNKPKDFLAVTGLKLEEFEKLKEGFKQAYKKIYPEEKTKEGKERKRREGAGVKGQLEKEEEKLMFILVYQKTNQLQTMQALQFEMSQAQANYWIHHLMPVLKQILKDLGLSPEREAKNVAESEMIKEGILVSVLILALSDVSNSLLVLDSFQTAMLASSAICLFFGTLV